MQLMSIDFGTQKIGVAVGQTITRTSTPLEVIKYKTQDYLWRSLEDIISEWKPELILIGYPINMDGSESEMSKKSNNFRVIVEKRFNVKTELIDERLSSFQAKDLQNKDGSNIDSLAAKIILDSWMEHHVNS
jgi:RNAse H-fold protein YqgF|tara:strand:- start:373 stop:768 length:396 start_codon:yes stop_codon:yes gene_type:complete